MTVVGAKAPREAPRREGNLHRYLLANQIERVSVEKLRGSIEKQQGCEQTTQALWQDVSCAANPRKTVRLAAGIEQTSHTVTHRVQLSRFCVTAYHESLAQSSRMEY
jgi:hypothetical protein